VVRWGARRRRRVGKVVLGVRVEGGQVVRWSVYGEVVEVEEGWRDWGCSERVVVRRLWGLSVEGGIVVEGVVRV
jgi:hypothetical protein